MSKFFWQFSSKNALAVVLGATYRGCDLLGELAENMSRLNIDSEGRKNNVGQLQMGEELKKTSQTSLRRSLSLVMLSELVTPFAMCDSEISENQVSRCPANVARNVLPSSCSSSKEQHSADNDDFHWLSSAVSDDDCSFAEIPPLSQRLQLNNLESDFAVTDSISGRGLASFQLLSSDNITDSRKDKLENFSLKQSSQKSVKSDSAILPGRRRRALMLHTASLLSDVFDFPKPGASEHKACSAVSTEIEKIVSEDDSGSNGKDTDIFQSSRLDGRLKDSFTENIVQSSLDVVDKDETFEPVSMSESSLPKVGQTSIEYFLDTDHHVTTDVVALSNDKLTYISTGVHSQELHEQSTWSPRHCGNFCIETSIISTPVTNLGRNVENVLQVDEFSLNDLDNLSDGIRTPFHSVITGSDENACIDEVISNNDICDMSDLLFDDSVSLAEELSLPLNVSKDHCNISVTEHIEGDCNDGDYSVIVID